MPNIDFSQRLTAEILAAEADARRAAEIKRACTARIEDVLDARTEANLAGAALAGLFAPGEADIFAAAQNWKLAMVAECRRAIAEGDDPVWIDVNAGVAALAAKY